MIPKILHCIWISEKPMPKEFEAYVQTWKDKMPDYEINYVTLSNIKHGDFVDRALANKNYTIANHYARCQEVYEKGGIYLDLDVEVIKSFDDLLDNQFFAGFEDRWVINNATFGAVPNHFFLKRCMDYMDNFDISTSNVELETGPRMFSKLASVDLKYYPPEYFYPYHYTEPALLPHHITKNTHSIHHWAKSWKQPLITVVIPCYNYAKYLPECIESVRKQTYKEIEIIVVNDGSPDDTFEVCKKLGVTCLSKPNGGLSSARNYGIKHAKGEYIMCLDADDLLPPTSIENHMKIAAPGVLAQLGMTEFEASSNTFFPQGATKESILVGNTVYCNAVFYKKDWEAVGGADESEIMRLGYEDWETWIRMIWSGCKVKTRNIVGLLYRVHATSMTRTTTTTNRDKLKEYIREKNKSFYEQLYGK